MTGEIIIRDISLDEVSPALFDGFIRHQEVTRCLRREIGAWVVKDIAFTEEWGSADFVNLSDELRAVLLGGGFAAGAFAGGGLAGFVIVSGELFLNYAILLNMQVSYPFRGRGLGRGLFNEAKRFARELGAEKLYISSHSSLESQAFYEKMGCADAEKITRLAALEPCDRQLECSLNQ